MTEWTGDFMPRDGHLFAPTMGELLARFVRRRWPRDTAKHVSRNWDVEPVTATNLTKGHASERTITKALKAEGWPLLMALGEAVTGESYEQFLRGVIDEHNRAKSRAEARQANLRSLEARAGSLVDLRDRGVDRHEGPSPL